MESFDGLSLWRAWGGWTLALLEWVATAAFALAGVMKAARLRMDAVGVCVVAGLSAFGGGTLRDILLDHRPFFWVRHEWALAGVLLLCVLCMLFLRQRHFELTEKAILWPDAVGLGLFNAAGVHQAFEAGWPLWPALLMGVVTAAFGGVLRDVVCNEVPTSFRDHSPYALCALIGGMGYAALQAHAPEALCLSACVLITLGLRVLAIARNWTLPAWSRD